MKRFSFLCPNVSGMMAVRLLVQGIAFGIFIFQMYNSIQKYIEKPVIPKKSTMPYIEIDKPVIYVCQEDQFNYTKAQNNGYRRKTFYTIGKLEDSENISWRGLNKDRSAIKLQEHLFDVDYSSLNIEESNTFGISNLKPAVTGEIFDSNYGYCKKMMETKLQLIFKSTQETSILMVDPATDTGIRISEMDQTKVTFGPTRNGLYDGHKYELGLTLHNSNLFDGLTCRNYKNVHSSYGDCIEGVLEKKLEEWYKCSPPWFPKKSNLQKCNNNMILDLPTLTNITDEFVTFMNGQDMSFFKLCLPPCTKMSVNMRKTAYYSNKPDNSKVEIIAKNEVELLTDINAYDVFSLIVDLGSAMGLWLGLSALSIFDIVMDGYLVAKQKYYESRVEK